MNNDPPYGGSCFLGWGYCCVALSMGSFDSALPRSG
jgi:hypothetical protein